MLSKHTNEAKESKNQGLQNRRANKTRGKLGDEHSENEGKSDVCVLCVVNFRPSITGTESVWGMLDPKSQRHHCTFQAGTGS